MPIDEDPIETRIKQVMTLFSSTDEIEFELDSAIYFLEASLNYTYSNAQEIREQDEAHEDSLVIEVDGNGNINIADLASAFNDISILVENYYGNSSIAKIYAIDIEPYDGSTSNGHISIKVTTLLKIGNVPSVTEKWFNSGVGYYWGKKLGKCDETMVNQIDATDVLEEYGNFNMGQVGIAVPTGKRAYFTAVQTVQRRPYQVQNLGVPFASTGAFGFSDIFGYENLATDDKVCLDDDKLNYYLDRMQNSIVPSLKPTGKYFIRIDVNYFGEGVVNNLYEYEHFYRSMFGSLTITNDPSAL